MSSKDLLLEGLMAAGTRETTSFTVSNGTVVPIKGLSIVEVCRVVSRFPQHKRRFFDAFGIGPGEKSEHVGSILIEAGPDLASAAIAVSAGRANDKRFELAIAGLDDVDLLDLLAQVKTATMPEGLAPFFVRFVPTAIRTGLLTQGQAEKLIADLLASIEKATTEMGEAFTEAPSTETESLAA